MTRRILMMDDDISICNLSKLLLGKLGYEVDTTLNGEDAVAAYEKALQDGRPYLAVILDMTIDNGTDGSHVLLKLRAINPRVYAILASGSAADTAPTAFKTMGFNDCLPKPFRVAEVQGLLVWGHKVRVMRR